MAKPTLIRVSCPTCGEVRVPLGELAVRLCLDDRQWSYCFRCRVCGRAAARASDRQVLDVVLALGVEVETWRLPAELSEPRPTGLPLTLDDVLDFHLLLEQADSVPVTADVDGHLGADRAARPLR